MNFLASYYDCLYTYRRLATAAATWWPRNENENENDPNEHDGDDELMRDSVWTGTHVSPARVDFRLYPKNGAGPEVMSVGHSKLRWYYYKQKWDKIRTVYAAASNSAVVITEKPELRASNGIRQTIAYMWYTILRGKPTPISGEYIQKLNEVASHEKEVRRMEWLAWKVDPDALRQFLMSRSREQRQLVCTADYARRVETFFR
jgi:hypothetical protein